MYTSFFGLTEKPFAITPDPRYLYLSERHAEALAHLAYGIKESGGFIQLTGEVGTGKTTVLRSLLQQLPPNCDVALILNPRITAPEFLAAICDELNVTVLDRARGSVKELVDLLSGRLLESHSRGRRVVLMVDEAQNLSPDVLEQVRLLTNLETATQKLLQIILIGQPELRVVLSSNELRQLAQRITGRYHLEALTRAESEAYIRHRLRVAGATADIFTRGALAEIHRLAGGIPRIMNVISDRALLGAYSREEHRIGADLVRTAASEVYGRPVAAPWLRWVAVAAAAGDEAEIDLRLAEARLVGGDAHVAGHRELAAAAEAKAVDHRDHRLREGGHDVEDAGAAHREALVERRTAGELADVGAGDERLLARAGDDDHADAVVGLDLRQRGQQLHPHLFVERVELVGAVDGEDGDAAFAGGKYGLGHESPRFLSVSWRLRR